VAGAPVSSWAAAAARWAARGQSRFFDEAGRHRFGFGAPFGHAVAALAVPYRIDPDRAEILAPQSSPAAAVYERFFVDSGVAASIPESVVLAGISAPMGPQLVPALLLARHLKAWRPQLRVVLGGPSLSVMADEDLAELLLVHPEVDCAVRFDGEYPLLELTRQALAQDWRPQSVAGVSCRDGQEVVHIAPGPGPNVNQLPAPLYDRAAVARLSEPRLGVTQARGCYWGKCDYCDFVELFEGSAPFRGRHAGNFVDELQQLRDELGARRFYFITESIPPAFARKASQLIIDRRLDIAWHSFAMVDRRFDAELLELMKASGCDGLTIGLETMTTRVLRLVHKSATREENIRFLQDARKAGISLTVNLIVDLPTTTFAEAMATLQDMETLTDCVDHITVFPFEATRSSNVGRDPGQFGLLVNQSSAPSGQAQYALNHLRNIDPAMTDKQRAEALRRYRQFADSVNQRARTGQPPGQARAVLRHADLPGRPERLRLTVEDMDLHTLADGKMVCSHMRTQRRYLIDADEAALLRPFLDGQPFSEQQLSGGWADPARLIGKLHQARMITAVHSPVPEPALA